MTSLQLHLRVVAWLPLPRGARPELEEGAVNRYFGRAIRQARAQNPDGVAARERDHYFALGEVAEEREALYTTRLLRTARRLRVPVPYRFGSGAELNEEYRERGNATGEWYLTRAGTQRLRASIREELAARREQRAHWIMCVSAVTGLIGALTGLAAVYLNGS